MSRWLLLVDLQNDFLAAPGLDPPAGELVRRAATLLEGCRQAGIGVLHARTTIAADGEGAMPHWRAGDRRDCTAGTPGHAFPAALEPDEAEPIFDKTFFSAFSNPALVAALRERGADELILAGVHLHGCIRATATDAYALGYGVVIAADATASYDGLHAAISRRWLEARTVRFEGVESLLARVAAPDGVAGPAAALGAVPSRPAPDPLAAATRAAAAGSGWRRTATDHRSELLTRTAALLDERAGPLAALIADEIGKPVHYGLLEARRSAGLFRAAARLAVPGRVETDEATVRRPAVRVAAQITPWNNPLAVPAGKLAPALRLGCAVVWKPSPLAPATAAALLEILGLAGLSEDLVAVVDGGADVAEAVIEAAPVDAVSLTGSSAAGYAAQAICAARRIPLQAELGGNNAAIVWRDADLGAAAAAIAEGGLGCAGQRCTANRRVIVDAACLEPFVDQLDAAVAALELGSPDDPAVRIGPLVTAAARERVAAAVERAGEGAEVRRPGAGRKWAPGLGEANRYLEPALILAPDPDSEIVQRELFGPVIAVQPANGFDEAMRLLNGVSEGLVAALFSNAAALRERFLDEAEAGVLKLNRSTVDAGVESPFGGWGNSGVGPPEHGQGDLELYTRWQAIYAG